MKTISERRENLLGAFTVPKPNEVRYRSFLLVDDVMTSGATLQEAARALLQAGARRVDAVVFARGINATKPMPTSKAPQGDTEDLTRKENSEETPGNPGESLRRKIH
jgi:hypoxanthine phosphoribosyltransferase